MERIRRRRCCPPRENRRLKLWGRPLAFTHIAQSPRTLGEAITARRVRLPCNERGVARWELIRAYYRDCLSGLIISYSWAVVGSRHFNEPWLTRFNNWATRRGVSMCYRCVSMMVQRSYRYDDKTRIHVFSVIIVILILRNETRFSAAKQHFANTYFRALYFFASLRECHLLFFFFFSIRIDSRWRRSRVLTVSHPRRYSLTNSINNSIFESASRRKFIQRKVFEIGSFVEYRSLLSVACFTKQIHST